jgi:chromosome segregation ATPase
MSDYQKQIKQHQIEMEQLEKQLPKLTTAAKEAKRLYAHTRHNRAPYPHEVINTLSNAKSEIARHASEIKRLQALVDWEDGIRLAGTNIKKAQKEISQVQSDLRKLQEKRTKLSAKLQKLKEEKRTEIEKAQYVEKQAAASYSVALSDGDDAEEQRAEKALRQASEALAEVTRDKRGIATATQALKDEVEKLEAAIAESNQTLKDLRYQQLRAARFMWADRLDKAAQEFVAIAAHLHATEKAMGRSSSLIDLYVPLHVPFGPMSINEDTVTAKAGAISIEQLIAA